MRYKGKIVKYVKNDGGVQKGIVIYNEQPELLKQLDRSFVEKMDDNFNLLGKPRIIKLNSNLETIGYYTKKGKIIHKIKVSVIRNP